MKHNVTITCWFCYVPFVENLQGEKSEVKAKIINLSFTTGLVPNMLKIAKVCPVYKNGDKTDINNYRPISG